MSNCINGRMLYSELFWTAVNLNKELVRALDRVGYRGSIFAPRAAIWIDEDTYVEPDLMYVSDDLKAQMEPGRRTRADIVIEMFRCLIQNTTGKRSRIPIEPCACAKCVWSIRIRKKLKFARLKPVKRPSTRSAIFYDPKFFQKSRSLSLPFFPEPRALASAV